VTLVFVEETVTPALGLTESPTSTGSVPWIDASSTKTASSG
jgi:hypothetical protein